MQATRAIDLNSGDMTRQHQPTHKDITCIFFYNKTKRIKLLSRANTRPIDLNSGDTTQQHRSLIIERYHAGFVVTNKRINE